jgi:hypothetical protein
MCPFDRCSLKGFTDLLAIVTAGYPSFMSALLTLLECTYGSQLYSPLSTLNETDPQTLLNIAGLFWHEYAGQTWLSMFTAVPTFDRLVQLLFKDTPFEPRDVFGPVPTGRQLVNYLKLRAIGHCTVPVHFTLALDLRTKEVLP